MGVYEVLDQVVALLRQRAPQPPRPLKRSPGRSCWPRRGHATIPVRCPCLSQGWQCMRLRNEPGRRQTISRTQELWQRPLGRLAAAPANPFEGRQSSTREGKP